MPQPVLFPRRQPRHGPATLPNPFLGDPYRQIRHPVRSSHMVAQTRTARASPNSRLSIFLGLLPFPSQNSRDHLRVPIRPPEGFRHPKRSMLPPLLLLPSRSYNAVVQRSPAKDLSPRHNPMYQEVASAGPQIDIEQSIRYEYTIYIDSRAISRTDLYG
jgi:hypothetical protein